MAAFVRPSLAWFFIIEPFVLYYYGYRKLIIIASFFICFAVTQFNAARNYHIQGRWVHATVIDLNITHFENASYPKYLYLINAFKINFLEGHSTFLMKSLYEKGFIIKWSSYLLALLMIAINLFIWGRFIYRISTTKIRETNWGNVLMVAYFVGPTLLSPAGPRIRLPVEWILLL